MLNMKKINSLSDDNKALLKITISNALMMADFEEGYCSTKFGKWMVRHGYSDVPEITLEELNNLQKTM